ncbi:hypothetical protein [Blastococcus brunescens]|uniref:Uncharacterized protein n=1 Tax=Blastococcus brunescens TaxID=1564165 RepID=A0ABZ1ATW6_9ACTN|nr:hypothetical protein [Blastococcus sp. BMG 8361]WRL62023.1 hypothetical protein U6N30_18305 [Blastococcus sp. BMG 8361]
MLWLLVVLAVLVATMVASVAVGSRGVGWSDIVAALGGSSDTIEEAAVTKRIPARCSRWSSAPRSASPAP